MLIEKKAVYLKRDENALGADLGAGFVSLMFLKMRGLLWMARHGKCECVWLI